MDGDQRIWGNIFVSGREEREGKEEKCIWSRAAACLCVHAGNAEQLCAFVTIRAWQAGHRWLLNPHSLLRCFVPMPAGRASSFSLPHHLLLQIPLNIACPGIEFQSMVENKRERNPTPSPNPSPVPMCCCISGHCPHGAVGAGGTSGYQCSLWVLGAPCAVPSRGRMGMQGHRHSGILFPCMARTSGTFPANPTVSNYKAAPIPPSHLRSQERDVGALKSRLEHCQQAVLTATAGLLPDRTHDPTWHQGQKHGLGTREEGSGNWGPASTSCIMSCH